MALFGENMTTADKALATLDQLYAASYGEIPWEKALTQLADVFDHSVATLEFHDTTKRQLLHIETARIDPGDMATYAREYSDKNPRSLFLEKTGSSILFDQLCLSEAEMDKDIFYNDFLKPRNLRYFLSAESQMFDPHVKAVISLQRPGNDSGADESGVRLMTAFQPHLKRVCNIYWRQLRLQVDPNVLDRRLAGYNLTGAERRLPARSFWKSG